MKKPSIFDLRLPLFFLVCWLLSAGSALGAEAETQPLRILVGPPSGEMLNPQLFGTNLQWTGRGDGLMEGADFETNSSLMRKIKNWLSPPVVRFPGGALASRYSWADGVSGGRLKESDPKRQIEVLSDLSKRGTGLDFDGRSEAMIFGSAEYLQLLSALGSEGMVTANLNASPQDTADWLSWMIDARRSLNLQPPPEVIWWEIGNESYFNEEASHVSPEEYVEKFTKAATALRAAAEEKGVTVKIGAILEGNLIGVIWRRYAAEDADRWNKVITESLGKQADFFIVHLYAPYGVENLSDLDTRQLIMASPTRLSENLATVKTQMRELGLNTPLWVTEFNLMTTQPEKSWKYGKAQVQGAFVADLLMEFVKRNISGACFWSLLSNHNFGMIRDTRETWLRPAGVLYKNLVQLRGASLLSVEYGGEEKSEQVSFTVRNLEPVQYRRSGIMELEDNDPWLLENPTIQPVNALAFEQDERRYLMLVNRSARQTGVVSVERAVIVNSQDMLSPGFSLPPDVDGTVTLPPSSVRLIQFKR